MASKTISTILNLKDNFSETIKKSTANTSAFSKEMKQSGTIVSKLKSSVGDAFRDIGESIKHGIGFGAGIDIWEKTKEGFSEMTTFGSDLQKSLNGIQTASGYDEQAMSGMRKVMLDIYNDNFGESFEDIGESIKSISQQTGATGDDLRGLTENALLMRDTFGMEVSESVRAANAIMKQFGVTGDEAFNLIAQGKQKGLDFSGEMLDSINEYSVQFKKVGLNAEDMFNVFANGESNGAFNLDKVGDAVKEFSIRAVDGSKTTADGFTQLGFNSDNLSAKFARGGDVAKQSFVDVVSALKNMDDPLKQSQVGVELFGTQFEDLGINAISSLGNLNGGINNTVDALGSINKVQYNDIGSAFQGIKRNIETGVLLPISDAVLPRLSDFSNWFASNIPNIKEKISEVVTNFLNIASSIYDKVWPSISDLIDSVTNLGKTVYNSVIPAFDSIKPDNWNSVGDAIKDIVDKAKNVVDYINSNWPTIKPIIEGITWAVVSWKLAIMAVDTWIAITTLTASAWSTIELMIWGIRNATTAWELAQWALNVAMDANPVGLVAAAIAALGFVIYEVVKHFQEICDWAKKAWDWLTKWNDTPADNKSVTVTSYGQTADTSDSNLNNSVLSFGQNATGTQYWKGGLTTKNEHGDEIVDLPSGSRVYTASQSQKMLNNKNGHTFNFYFTGKVGTKEFFEQSAEYTADKVLSVMSNV